MDLGREFNLPVRVISSDQKDGPLDPRRYRLLVCQAGQNLLYQFQRAQGPPRAGRHRL
jgi:hypothetical protein